MGEIRNAYRILVRKPEESVKVRYNLEDLGRYRWDDNIKMDIREIGFRSVQWINLAWDRE
jgi:hypothetical protein